MLRTEILYRVEGKFEFELFRDEEDFDGYETEMGGID